MTKDEIVKELAGSAGITIAQARSVYNIVGHVVRKAANSRGGQPVRLPGLGNFKQVHVKARSGTSPQGFKWSVPAKVGLRFKDNGDAY